MIEEANELKLTPQVGLRVRLSSLASSKWADTGGERSKFGLSAAQLLSVIERFRAAEMDQGIRLLHFHMGSQIANRRITVRASVRLSATTPSYGR